MANFDLVVLGGGSGGYAAALRGAQLGLTVALIEKDKVGGTCLHRGCIPTKALLHAGEVADSARESSQFGVNATFNSIDMAGVNSYKDGVIAGLYKGLQGLVKSRNITFVEGSGRLVSQNTVEVNGTQYVGKNVVLATGSYAKTIPGLEIDGEMQGDMALSEQIRLRALPETRLKGQANLLIMPNLDAANISFNLLKAAAGDGITIGPMLLGAARPVHIVTPSSTVRQIGRAHV